ncbi:MAG: PstS family phosphate ABC transporter substrate-binding protein [Microcystaceae cyanobacterium]
MTQKNETIPLLIALIVTLGIVGGISWLIVKRIDPNIPTPPPSASPLPPSSPSGTTSSINALETLAEVKNVPSGLFSYGGSTTWAPIRKEVDQAVQLVHPTFKLRYTNPSTGNPGSGTGIKMLLQDQLAFSQSSRSLKDQEYETAKQRGFTLEQIPVAIDGIAIAVHPDLPIKGLTVDQLKQIYSGQLTNWQQVGGPNLPIIPYSRRPEAGGTVEFFRENILGDGSFGKNIQYTDDTTQGLRKVSENLGGIYYASAPEVVPQCTIKTLPIGRTPETFVPPYQEPFIPLSQCPQKRNQLNKTAFQQGNYPITRRLFVIVKKNGQLDEQAGRAYAKLLLSEQGQALVNKSGFVSIR